MSCFTAVGIGNLWIGSGRKCASTTIHKLSEKYSFKQKRFREHEINSNSLKFVVLIRNVWEKWRSGLITDSPYINEEYKNFDLNRGYFVGDKDEIGNYSFKPFYDNIIKYHAPECDLSWMWNKDHTKFWKWNNESMNSLKELSERENFYFLDISNLSTQTFRNWCISQDSKWESIKPFEMNNTSDSVGYYNFWKLHKHGGVLKNLQLVDPIIDLPANKKNDEIMFYRNLAFEEQIFLNKIKHSNKNYLNLK